MPEQGITFYQDAKTNRINEFSRLGRVLSNQFDRKSTKKKNCYRFRASIKIYCAMLRLQRLILSRSENFGQTNRYILSSKSTLLGKKILNFPTDVF